MRYRFIQFLLAVLVPLLGCQKRPDFDTYRAEILGLHKSFIEAHWAKDASALADPRHRKITSSYRTATYLKCPLMMSSKC